MALHPTGLGKGLDALIRESGGSRSSAGVQTVSLEAICPNPKQPRRVFDETALNELADSIRSQGLLQPLLVRPIDAALPGKYEIVAGERRWRACRMAGLKEVPVLVRDFSEEDLLAAALIENLQREDLNPMEEALGLKSLKDEFGLSQEELSKKIGKSRSAIANSLRLLGLPEDAQKALSDGKLSAGHARALLSVDAPDAQAQLMRIILEKGVSVREAEGLAAVWKEQGSFDLPGAGQPAFSDPAAALETGREKSGGKRPPRDKKPQSAVLLEAQSRINDIFQIPVKVTGKEDKGKISFSFNSRDELERLLDRLAGSALAGVNHEALSGLQQDSLNARSHTPLSGNTMQALTHKKAAVLPQSDDLPAENGGPHTPENPGNQ